MHKKLAADLTSLAHSILQMKNKEDVFALKEKAHEVYEKLALLAYVEEYINNTPNATTNKETLVAAIVEAEKNKTVLETNIIEKEEELVVNETPIVNTEITSDEVTLEKSEPIENIKAIENTTSKEETLFTDSEIFEQPFDEIENLLFGDDTPIDETVFLEDLKNKETGEETPVVDETAPQLELNVITPEEETPQLTLEVTETTEEEITEKITQNLEEEKEEEIPTTEKTIPHPVLKIEKSIKKDLEDTKKLTLEEELEGTISVDVMANLFEKAPVKKTINDRILNHSVKIDLNDRIAFVKNLFEGNQEDFNRVVSQLNTIKSEKEAKDFILKMVKPDYDWSTKETYEARLLDIIERRFN